MNEKKCVVGMMVTSASLGIFAGHGARLLASPLRLWLPVAAGWLLLIAGNILFYWGKRQT